MSGDKEFKDLPEGWKWVRLGEVAILVKNISPKGSKPYLEIGDIDIHNKKYSIKEKESPNHCIKTKRGNIVISKVRPTRGAISLINEAFLYVSPAFSVLEANNSKFLFYSLSMGQFCNYLGTLETGTTYPSVNDEDVLSYKLILPPLPEQQKIAEILETIDNAIEKTEKIIEKYKRIKQGLMQDLLTKGIDENGNIRSEKTHKFKDSPLGRIPEEWEVVRLGEIGEIVYGERLSDSDYAEYGNAAVYGTTGIIGKTEKYHGVGETIILPRKGSINNKFYIEKGQKFFVIDTAFYLKFNPKNMLNVKYVFNFIRQIDLEFFNEATGVPSLNRETLKNLLIPLHPLPEQQRIAEILSQIDQTIEKEQQYKEKLQRTKQGLMQDLLTGKVRVNHLVEEKEK
jgi:type I restriction enzyme S subunit